ncbi:MAG: leucyl aminopeptidase [Pseudomonadota bacterium]
MHISTIEFTVESSPLTAIETDCLIVALNDEQAIAEQQPELDAATAGFIQRMANAGELPKRAGQCVTLFHPAGIRADRLLIVGTGKLEKWSDQVYQRMAQGAGKALRDSQAVRAHCAITDLDLPNRNQAWKVQQAALALDHSDYRYEATKPPKDHAPPATQTVSFADHPGTLDALARASAIAMGVRRCRLLGDLPPNLCTPVFVAQTATAIADEVDGLTVQVLDQDQMQTLGMNALLAVAQGSINPPRLVHLSWRGGSTDQAPYAMVGKGVTFDTGGISLKPGKLMEQMKFDMCGAASAIGAIESIARMGLKLNVDCVVALVENMPDGNAYRPGDVITAMSGKTIEVQNTDAEGRMILADALTWTAQRLQPEAMVDIATLTGACVITFGHLATAIMTQDDELAGDLLAAGIESADRAWRLPLWDEYQPQIDSHFADMRNVGGSGAGSITAGCFLSRFAEGQRWAHLDIAGSAWRWGKAESASGRPVGLLTEWLMNKAV